MKSHTPTHSSGLKLLQQWHWISSAVCLVLLLLFAVTGITLNHAESIPAHPQVTKRTAQLPVSVRNTLTSSSGQNHPSLQALNHWLQQELQVSIPIENAEWSDDELYFSLPRPGGDGWLRIQLEDGSLEYEVTDGGWIAYLNDLHKGRHTGIAWKWMMDVFALACLVFCVSGLLLLRRYAQHRPSTWPLVGLGLVLPLLLIFLFVHA